jgi:hypothetical protein
LVTTTIGGVLGSVATTGSGNAVLAISPTFTGNTTTFANGAASQDYLVLQPGTGGTDQIGALEFANNAGTSQWEIRKDASNNFRIRDTVNSLDRLTQYAGGQTVINSGGSAAVAINNTSSAGTGGFIVYEGGSNYNTAAFTVTSSGNASVPGGFTSASLTDTGLTTAGVVTTTSGGVLGSEAQVTVAQGGTGAASTSQNYVFAGPTSGSGAPSFRTLVSGDIPNNAANTTGTAAGFSGSLAGDVTGTQSATTVGKVNGASVPASANGLSSNSSSQLVASTSHNLSVPANCAAASGSGTAYTCTTSPTFTPATGDHIQFKADVANTGSATLNVNGAGAATIYKWGNTSTLIAGDLQAGHWISTTYDGSHWQLEGQLGNANATQINGTAISGLSGSGTTLALTTSPTVSGLTATGTTSLATLNVSGSSTLTNVTINGTCSGSGCPTIVGSGKIEELSVGASSAFSGIGSLSNSGASVSVVTTSSAATPILLQSTSSTTAGSTAGFAGQGRYIWTHQPVLTWGFLLPNAADYASGTSARINLGLLNVTYSGSCSSFSAAVGTDTPFGSFGCTGAMIQYSNTRSDSAYQCIVGNGTTQTTTPITGATPSTSYTTASIAINASSVVCTVGSYSATVTTNLPSQSYMYTVFENLTASTTATHLSMYGLYSRSQNSAF